MSKKEQPEGIVLIFPTIEEGSISDGTEGTIIIENHQGVTTDADFAKRLIERHGAMTAVEESPRRRSKKSEEEGPKE